MEEQGSMLGKWLECALGEALSGSPPSCAENGEGEMQWDLERQPTKTREESSRRGGQDWSKEATGH